MSEAAVSKVRSACPFCGQVVERRIIAYGGKCPQCFGEIPGEEAATDPGLERGAAQVAAAAKKVAKTRRLPFLLAALVLLAPLGGAAYLAFAPKPVMPVLNLDDAEYAMDDMELVAAVEAIPGGVPAVGTPLAPRTMRPRVKASGTEEPGMMESEQGSEMETQQEDQGFGLGDLRSKIDRRKHDDLVYALQDEDAIVDMIKKVIKKGVPTLSPCYNAQLNGNPTLAGSWLLEFTVTQKGTVANPRVTGKDGVANKALEECAVGILAGWKFTPIKADQPVAKSVLFRPG